MSSLNSKEIVQQAMAHVNTGRFKEACELFVQLCQANRHDPWNWMMLGAVHGELGSLDDAVICLRRAVELQPGYPQALYTLGKVFSLKGDLKESMSCMERAITSAPNYAEPWVAMSWLNIQLDDLQRAESSARKAIAIQPKMPEAHYALGNAMQMLKQVNEAIDSYRHAVALRSQFADAHFQLGNMLVFTGDFNQAAACYRLVIQLAPKYVAAYKEFAILLHKSGNLHEAIIQYQNVLALHPDDARSWGNLGNAYHGLGALDEAENCQRHALQIDPNLAVGHANLGNVLKSKGRVREAISCYRRAIELDPHYVGAHSNLLLCFNYLLDYSRENVLEEHRKWEKAHGLAVYTEHHNDHDPERRLRVGYVSPDLRTHAAAYFIEPLLQYHDPSRFEIICYGEIARPDKVTERMKGYAQKWHNTCGCTDAQLIDMIRADGVDILVDLAGHTADSRLVVFTAKPAPVQTAYIGYANTTGLSTIDYRLTDDLTDPPADQKYYTEKLVYLKNGFSCYAAPPMTPEISPLPASKVGYMTFASFNNLFKINDSVIDLWCRVLHACPMSRMRMFRHVLKGKIKEEIYQVFERRGIDRRRIDLWSEIPQKYAHLPTGLQHLGLYEEIDLTLDTFPWNGHTISCESLWMGAPVVTLFGDRHAGRICASILHAIGLPQLVALDSDHFLKIVTRLANDTTELAQLRSTLRERMRSSPLCDGKEFAKGVEAAYRHMWRHWCAKKGGSTVKKVVV